MYIYHICHKYNIKCSVSGKINMRTAWGNEWFVSKNFNKRNCKIIKYYSAKYTYNLYFHIKIGVCFFIVL